ncbi:MAG: MerR family DNA-binding transcriptional regulator [Candidatus Omnitrophota bacterium]|nr:MAG: MerR family DNA-binding transcriptional regulator [Candidatus Omnitrophota bacterium]
MKEETFYTTKDVLKKTKISRNTLFLWLKKGKIPEVPRDRNGHRLFTEKDISNIVRYKNKKIFPHGERS